MEHIKKIIPEVMNKLTPKEFQAQHGLTNEELDFVKYVCVITKGTISSVVHKEIVEAVVMVLRKNKLVKGGLFKEHKSKSFYKGQWKRETSK